VVELQDFLRKGYKICDRNSVILRVTFGEKILAFNKDLVFSGELPENIQILNPFRGDPQVDYITTEFYTRFFSDHMPRTMILGINPGRLGAGATGIPFTDTKRLNEKCGIEFRGFQTHEPSSAFVYEMIEAMGGVSLFYSRFFVSAICPLGFTTLGKGGKPVNFNYYDDKSLMQIVYPFILDSIQKQISFGVNHSVCYCLGSGKNEKFLRKLNGEHHFFDKIVPLEHPRFVMQYRTRSKQVYIEKYVKELGSA
jgi:hypothetical protein